MKVPSTILVPVDFSDSSVAALDYAVELASRLDATIHLLYVVGVQMLGIELGTRLTTDMVDSMVEGAQKELDRLAASRASRATFAPTRLETGDPRAQIEQTAVHVGADLIVMGTHGRRGMRRFLLGSVAESVAREARCPVMLVRKEAVQ
jgi:nucleotide-binding universal stress UspA family protein